MGGEYKPATVSEIGFSNVRESVERAVALWGARVSVMRDRHNNEFVKAEYPGYVDFYQNGLCVAHLSDGTVPA